MPIRSGSSIQSASAVPARPWMGQDLLGHRAEGEARVQPRGGVRKEGQRGHRRPGDRQCEERTRITDWKPDLADPAAAAHLVWAAMHGLVTIELMHRRWGGPLVAHLEGDPEQNFARAIRSLLEALDG